MIDNNNLVLILDDDQDIHNLLKLELSKTKFVSMHALNENEALELLGKHDFTYGIFDIILSNNTSSNEVIKFLSSDKAAQNQGLPLVIMSAHMTDDYAKKLRLKGVSIIDTLQKPIKSGELTSLLNGDGSNSILLLEDDPDTSKLIKSELEKNSHKVYSVQDCQSAIKLLQTTTFLCAIIDNKLGADESSEEFFHYLRNEGLDLKLPLILTGTTVREDLEVDSFLLVFDTVEKPFKRGAFVKSTERLLNWKESQNSPDEDITLSNIDNLEDLLQVVAGNEAENQLEDILVTGDIDFDSATTLVSGSSHNEDDEAQLIKGQAEEQDENILVSGDSGEQKLNAPLVVKGAKPKINTNRTWAVQNLQAPPSPDDIESGQPYDPNQRNEDGITSVMMASLMGDVKMLEDTILHGGDIGLRSKDGKSPLHYAAASKNPDAINYLLEQGLKVNIRDEHSREALYYAISSKNIDNVNTLLKAGSRSSTRFEGKSYLTIAVLAEHIPSVISMLEQGLSPTFKDYSGKTPLDYAKLKGNDEIHQLLLEKTKT